MIELFWIHIETDLRTPFEFRKLSLFAWVYLNFVTRCFKLRLNLLRSRWGRVKFICCFSEKLRLSILPRDEFIEWTGYWNGFSLIEADLRIQPEFITFELIMRDNYHLSSQLFRLSTLLRDALTEFFVSRSLELDGLLPSIQVYVKMRLSSLWLNCFGFISRLIFELRFSFENCHSSLV